MVTEADDPDELEITMKSIFEIIKDSFVMSSYLVHQLWLPCSWSLLPKLVLVLFSEKGIDICTL